MPDETERIFAMELANRAILGRAAALAVPDRWLTGGAVLRAVWNALDVHRHDTTRVEALMGEAGLIAHVNVVRPPDDETTPQVNRPGRAR